jgi:hypothetical protein
MIWNAIGLMPNMGQVCVCIANKADRKQRGFCLSKIKNTAMLSDHCANKARASSVAIKEESINNKKAL